MMTNHPKYMSLEFNKILPSILKHQLNTQKLVILFFNLILIGMTVGQGNAQNLNFNTTKSLDQPQRVLFLNQVRGGECCDAGSVANLEKQRQFFAEHDLQVSFLFRYDALIDNKYQSVIHRLI